MRKNSVTSGCVILCAGGMGKSSSKLKKRQVDPQPHGFAFKDCKYHITDCKTHIALSEFWVDEFLSICTNVLVEWESPRQSDRRGELIPNLTALLSRTANITLIFIIPRQPMLSDGLMPHNVVKIFLKEPILNFHGPVISLLSSLY